MTSKHETGTNSENEPVRYPEQPAPASSENAYDRLTAYRFVRRFVEGKIVANVGRQGIGAGSRLLAGTAESVEGLTDSPEAADLASALHHAPNVSYQRVDLSGLPYVEDHFDVLVALEVAESPERTEGLVSEAKRVLKQDGLLVISAPDKQNNTNAGRKVDGQQEMYVREFRELLERHFGRVRLYRQGVLVGGFVFPASGEATGAAVETTRFSSTAPDLGAKTPTARSIIAVCRDAEDTGQEEQPYVLLDRDRSVFDELEERAEDAELLREEIRQMQETEVQAFLDALRLQQSLSYMLTRYRIHLRTHLRNIIVPIRTESRMYRRLATPYRWLRGKNGNSG